ncbi:PucR family transcriptional regulator [Microbacterium saperdae]|uniref:PucR-like helix-turn-helix protein n=1 Tax=Microbacterium saperdae TaxID=69368 RepID=A0A543BM32_9MICO|nr:helix-turn-helix domain-containing protein [Microbacterium saperdae]TQL85853.1 PucR-like helix-turn-helix protein [Microbacterium saperdae]GGM52551.1 transcriptional regulator [Microbacterium saperdae]
MTNIEPTLGGTSVRDIVLGNREIVDRIITAIAPTNPEQHGTGDASQAADIRWAVEHSLQAAADSLTGRPNDDELLRASAVRRFEEGSSFSSVIAAYHRGVAVIWEQLRAHAGREDDATLAECARLLFVHLERITSALAADFERTWTVSRLGERDARFAIFTALTQGGDAEGEAHRSGRTLASRYGILVVRLRRAEDSSPGDVIARRETQRLRSAIDSVAGGEVLAVLGAAGGTALVPLRDGGDTIEDLRRALQAGFGRNCTGAWVEAGISEIADALHVAEELLEIALAIRGEGEVHTLDDLLLEYQSARPGPGRALLARRIDGVGDELLQTVDAYLASGGDRRSTAAALHVHPNTVDYRLGRVLTLTGMEATTPEGAAQLRAARVANRLERAAHERLDG